MYKKDSALNNLQWLICHKTKPKPNHIYLVYMYKKDLALNNIQWLICHKPNQRAIVGCPRGVMVKPIDCAIVVSSNPSCVIAFTFGQIPVEKVCTPLIFPAICLNSSTAVILDGRFSEIELFWHLTVCKQKRLLYSTELFEIELFD